MKKFNKIFGIGLGKTGLHSLTAALNILGIKALQNWKTAKIDRERLLKKYRMNDVQMLKVRCLRSYEAHVSGGKPCALITFHEVYHQLDQEYPGSKFILTVRDLDNWLVSTEKHIERNKRDPNYRGDTLIFKRELYLRQWQVHHQEVLDYFKDRPDDLLVINICAGEGWEKLCPFLGCPVLDVPFPQKNTAKEYENLPWMQNKPLRF